MIVMADIAIIFSISVDINIYHNTVCCRYEEYQFSFIIQFNIQNDNNIMLILNCANSLVWNILRIETTQAKCKQMQTGFNKTIQVSLLGNFFLNNGAVTGIVTFKVMVKICCVSLLAWHQLIAHFVFISQTLKLMSCWFTFITFHTAV